MLSADIDRSIGSYANARLLRSDRSFERSSYLRRITLLSCRGVTATFEETLSIDHLAIARFAIDRSAIRGFANRTNPESNPEPVLRSVCVAL